MRVSSKVARVLQGENISLDELTLMVDKAAILSSKEGYNRRYYHWLFKIQGEEILDMRTAQTLQVGGGKEPITEEHEECDGQGCKNCGWSGSVTRWITDKIVPKWEPLRMRVRASLQ